MEANDDGGVVIRCRTCGLDFRDGFFKQNIFNMISNYLVLFVFCFRLYDEIWMILPLQAGATQGGPIGSLDPPVFSKKKEVFFS